MYKLNQTMITFSCLQYGHQLPVARMVFLLPQGSQEREVHNPTLVTDKRDELECPLLGGEGEVEEDPVLLLREDAIVVEVRDEVRETDEFHQRRLVLPQDVLVAP